MNQTFILEKIRHVGKMVIAVDKMVWTDIAVLVPRAIIVSKYTGCQPEMLAGMLKRSQRRLLQWRG
jgi:hypothetical protein